MSPRIEVRLDEARRCAKPNCRHDEPIHRHHKGHEFLWKESWRHTREHEERYKAFVERYYEFRSEDTVDLCAAHHAEIHYEYFLIFEPRWLELNLLPLENWSWEEAERMMQRFREFCDEWIKTSSPGRNPRHLGRNMI